MGPSSYFGNTLTDLQSGITAGERNAGDTERARVAADAAKMSAYFNMISNKARTEAEARAREAENAKGYFALNMADAQKKAQLSQETALAGQQWAEQAKLQAGTLAAQERMNNANNVNLLDRSKLQFSDTRVTPQVALEQERQKADKERTIQASNSLASMANQALSAAKAKKKIVQQSVWDAKSTPEARQLGMANADQAFLDTISKIQSGLGNDAELIRFNPTIGQFEPAFTVNNATVRNTVPTARMIPPELQEATAPAATPRAAQPSGNVIWRIGPDGKLIRPGAPAPIPTYVPDDYPTTMF